MKYELEKELKESSKESLQKESLKKAERELRENCLNIFKPERQRLSALYNLSP